MPGELAVIFDRGELDRYEAGPDAPALVFESEAHAGLIARGIDAITPESLIGPAARDTLRDLDRAALAFWGAQARVEHAGLNIFDLVPYRHARWIHRLLYPAFTLLRAIDEHRPAALRLLDTPSGHALDRPAGTRRMTALHALAAGIASMRDLTCHVAPPLLGPTDEPATAPSAANGPARVPPGHVLMIGSGPDLRRHAAIARAWREIDDRPVIHVYQAPDEAGLAALAGAGETALAERAYTGEAPEIGALAAGPARAAFEGAARILAEPLRAVFANPGLAGHFDFLFGPYAHAMATNAARWRRAIGALRPGVVVSSYPTVALDVAAALGLPTLILPHGPMMTQQPEYHALLPASTSIAAVGRRHAELLIREGIAAERIHVTGVVGAPAARPARGASPPVDPPTLLIPTSDTSHPAALGMLPAVGFDREGEAMRELLSAACARGWRVVIRRHPRYDRDESYYRSLAPAGAGSFLRLTDGANAPPFDEAVSQSSAVVLTGAPSSAIPEASGFGRPVYLLAQAAMFFDPAAWGLDAWPIFDSVTALTAELETLFADPARRARRASQCAAAARDFLGAQAGTPETATAHAIARARGRSIPGAS